MVHASTSGGLDDYSNVKTIKAVKPAMSMTKGQTRKMKVTITTSQPGKPMISTGHTRKLRYYSGNKKVVRIDKNGKILPKGIGRCYVYAYAHNGFSAEMQVTVTEKKTK